MKRQKVFYDITQEHPAEIYRLEEYSAFVIRKDSEGVFLLGQGPVLHCEVFR